MDHRTSTYSAKRFQAKVTGRHAITLPAELCRVLGIEVGDTVEFEVGGCWATFKRSGDEPDESIRGILRDIFPDMSSIEEFIREERSEWDEEHQEIDCATSQT
ncbi:hypothetical protein BH23CHL4_BH23CHL4_14770 [soil metagenome]